MSSRFRSVVTAVAWRNLHNFFTNPALFIPALMFPLFFFTAFAGGLSRIDQAPGFDFPSGYTAFQFVFVILQASAFGGVFTGFAIARDYESGFGRRMMLAAPNRRAILGGYALAALGRALFTYAVLFLVALLAGMQLDGSGVDLAGLIGLGILVNFAALMFAAGIAMRFRSIQAGPLMQTPVFLALFMAPVYVPIDLLEGWIETAANANPISVLLDSGRSLISGQPEDVVLAFAIAAALGLAFLSWALRGLKRAEAAGG
jgi:ABC-2 type transport system permease protein